MTQASNSTEEVLQDLERVDIPFHEVVYKWPSMSPEEFAALVADIKMNGLREPIWTYQGKIIDGRNRYLACREAGVESRYQEWNGNGSLILFVASLNQHRRHLDAGQKAFIAVEIEKALAEEAKHNMSLGGGDRRSEDAKSGFQRIEKAIIPIHAAKEAAKVAGTNHQYVADAKKVNEQAPELKHLVMERKMSLPDARRLAKEPELVRKNIVTKVLSGIAKDMREAKALHEHEMREAQANILHTPQEMQLIHGDFNEEVKKIEDGSIDLIITDPPYNISENTHNIKLANRSDKIRDFGEWDKYSREEFLDLLAVWSSEWMRILRPQGSGYVFCAERYLSHMIDALVNAGLEYKSTITWCKTNPGCQIYKVNFRSSVEHAVFFTKGQGGHTFNWQGENEMRNYIQTPICQGNERLVDALGHTLHPTQKPESVIRYLMTVSSNPGDMVFDGFAGVFTTVKVAYDMGRRSIGIEQDATYFEAGKRRVSIVEAQEAA